MSDTVSLSNRKLLEAALARRRDFFADPQKLYPWWRPCRVQVLLVTDGGLDFGEGDFGLSTFVRILRDDRPSYARFALTLAHLRSDVTPAQLMQGAPGIAGAIAGFRFDEPSHFTPDKYDQVWLFGIETNFHRPNYAQRDADRARYPADRLGDGELRALSAFMNGQGGVFATGDHGALGRALCGAVNRVRGMRHWSSFPSGDPGTDQVSMTGARRNDTNQIGRDAGSQFSDQSDDVPQKLDLTLYGSRLDALRTARYPHPILCGPGGRIDVLPDHPHEGECRVPPDLTLRYELDGSVEYPPAANGSGQVVPEVVARSRVPAGNDARGSKRPTVAHSFGAISAYDGHRAGVGRVVCDSTWHHFVNVNLIGVVEGGGFDEFRFPGEDPSKHDGFLSSAQGLAVLDRIKAYYTNIAVWIARPDNVACFHRHFWRVLAYKDRIMEAALVDPDTDLRRIPAATLRHIGIHARDVLGLAAGRCQSIQWTLDWVRLVWPEIRPWIDPWEPVTREQPEVLPVFDPMPLVDAAAGGALVGLRQVLPYPPAEVDDDFDRHAVEAAMKGAQVALRIALEDARQGTALFAKLVGQQGPRGDRPASGSRTRAE